MPVGDKSGRGTPGPPDLRHEFSLGWTPDSGSALRNARHRQNNKSRGSTAGPVPGIPSVCRTMDTAQHRNWFDAHSRVDRPERRRRQNCAGNADRRETCRNYNICRAQHLLLAQIRRAHLRVVQQRLGIVGQRDAALLQHVAAVAGLQREAGVLFNQQ